MQPNDRKPVKALVLAGGRSRRMGQDKAAMIIDGQSMLARTVGLAQSVAVEVLVGVREASTDRVRGAFKTIADAGIGQGPLDGILAALQHDENADWLVLACDMPLLDAATLQALCKAASNDANSIALAMANATGELPEPLCAIWRAPMRAAIESSFAQGRFCARKCLNNARATLVDPVTNNALFNMNSAQDLDAARQSGAALA